MKKTKILLELIIAIILVLALSSCDFFSGASSDNQINEKQTVIRVYNGTVGTDYTVQYGQEVKVDVPTKSGYYFDGFYTEKEGGEKYFDISGKSSMVWQKGLPTEFYAQWKPITELFFEKETRIENPKSWSGYGYPGFTFDLTPEIKNAIKGNLDKEVKVTYSFDLKDTSKNTYSDMQFYLSNSLGSGREELISKVLDSTTTTIYKHYSGSTTTTARKFLNEGKICMAFKKTYGYSDYYSVKNLKVTLEFVE